MVGAAANTAAARAPAPNVAARAPAPNVAARAPEPNVPVIGTMVLTLPGGCETSSVNDVQYYKCSGSYYRPIFGNNGVYYQVVVQPF